MACPDILITAVGQNRLFQNTPGGRFIDVTEKSGLGGRKGFSTSALWFDYDRDGYLDLLVCNYVKWSPQLDAFCSVDGKRKSYCTPEAYHGDTCWLFRNRGNGTFEDVTAKSGIFDPTSKSLGVTLLDYDHDGWPDLLSPTIRSRTSSIATSATAPSKMSAVRAGVAFSEDGKARAGMGIDAADFDNSGVEGIAITNFDNEMMALYRPSKPGVYTDIAVKAGIGQPSRDSLGFGCSFLDINLDGRLDLVAVNGHIDETVRQIHGNTGYAQAPHLFLNRGGTFSGRGRAGWRRLRHSQSGAAAWHSATSTGTAISTCWSPPIKGKPTYTGTTSRPASAAAPPAHRHEMQPGRYRLGGPADHRGRNPVANGEDRVELPLAIGIDADIRIGAPRCRQQDRGGVG